MPSLKSIEKNDDRILAAVYRKLETIDQMMLHIDVCIIDAFSYQRRTKKKYLGGFVHNISGASPISELGWAT